MSVTFTPPTIDEVSPVALDTPPLWNRLMRHYRTRPRGRAIWELVDGTLTFDQPYPTIEDTGADRATLFPEVPTPPSGLGTSSSNLVATTYERVFLGGHVYELDSDDPLITDLANFLHDNGYDPHDWLEGAVIGGYGFGYWGGYGG